MSARPRSIRPGPGPLDEAALEQIRERMDREGRFFPGYGEPLSARYRARKASRVAMRAAKAKTHGKAGGR